MKLHGNARTCPKSRGLLVERFVRRGRSLAEAAEAAGVSGRTARKWVARFGAEGDAGLLDRWSRPRRIPHRTPAERVESIEALRKLGKRSRLEPPEPPNRYERRRPGELVHVDVKRLGRFKVAAKRVVGGRHASRGYGWDFVHVMVDDCSRLAYAEVLGDERGDSAVGFLERGIAWFGRLGVEVERVMTDNGSPYVSTAHAVACRQLGLRHLRTRPYRPRTNGKAERFIQTLQNEWAYGRLYRSSDERAAALHPFLNHYNYRRRHGSLGHQPPATRLNNLIGNYS